MDEWSYIGDCWSVFFINFNVGIYIFKVKVVNNDGVWNFELVVLEIIIKLLFWRMFWAYVFYIFIFVLLFFGFWYVFFMCEWFKNNFRFKDLEC